MASPLGPGRSAGGRPEKLLVLGKSSWNGDLIGGFNPSQNVCVIQGIIIPNIVDNSNILFQRFETTP
jgi:hypothetical protein